MFIIVEYSAICKVIENPIIKYRTRMKEVIHLFTYAPLWQTLKDKGISQYELIKTYHISTGTLDALRKNKSVTMNTLHDICVILDCPIEAVVKIEKVSCFFNYHIKFCQTVFDLHLVFMNHNFSQYPNNLFIYQYFSRSNILIIMIMTKEPLLKIYPLLH